MQVNRSFRGRQVCKEKLNVKSVYNDKLILLISLAYLICTALAMWLYKFVILRYAILAIAIIVLVIKHKFVINLFKRIKSN